ncbi:YsnF/AvaK domain-containing protein [Heliobacterium chlorum]|uniref:YsnF/AvaK domain-containing protein n=1 Tax=Heliobacterium chlorum TaxID=2698 RepID=A0ABR7T3R1_HELCL|nr:YsnF/AvaK domain-containing protein [Heliobacterium chlorum]MBC9784615.1 YsnF/AvaK domain-containing protein [Heliobacterium chlorum]
MNVEVGQRKTKYLVNGIVGGVVTGALVGGILAIFGGSAIIGISLITGGILGAVIGLYKYRTIGHEHRLNGTNTKMQLREEQLDIVKRPVQRGEVTVRKEVVTENRNIVVPVLREELVIEKKDLDTSMDEEERPEPVRIPLREEAIEVVKHPRKVNEVELIKRQIQENKSVKETLKKEMLHIESGKKARVSKK